MLSTLTAALALAGAAAALPTARDATVQFVGTNIAGFDFGCSITGQDNLTQATPPLSALGGPDGAGQMAHFVKDDGMNIFRLPVGWQYLLNNKLGGTLDAGNTAKYDQLVQACLATGSYCIIDIHNYREPYATHPMPSNANPLLDARWDGQIIGQGGPTNDQFANLWSQLATRYAATDKIVFGIMNEPHDVPDINKWADSVQAAVTAIRAVATKQMILLPGNDWTSAQQMPTKSGPALLKVKNPDGSFDGLIFDVHKYLDSDNSGTHTECVTDNISTAFQPLAAWLRTNKRQALNTETGGGNTASCQKYLCSQIQFMNQNTDVFLGYVGWSAGAFSPNTYELSEVPTKSGSGWTDSALVKSCIARKS